MSVSKIALAEAACAISAFWKTHSCKLIPNWTWNGMITYTKAQFRAQTFHEPNLIPWIKYMKSLASESVKNGYLNLEQLSPSSTCTLPRSCSWSHHATLLPTTTLLPLWGGALSEETKNGCEGCFVDLHLIRLLLFDYLISRMIDSRWRNSQVSWSLS